MPTASVPFPLPPAPALPLPPPGSADLDSVRGLSAREGGAQRRLREQPGVGRPGALLARSLLLAAMASPSGWPTLATGSALR